MYFDLLYVENICSFLLDVDSILEEKYTEI